MHRLSGRRESRRRESGRLASERGAVATIVAIMLGGGVLMGFGALTIDVGNLLWERRQLQNGADAAVLDLARICGTATGASTACSTGDAGTNTALEQLVDTNANDGAGDLVTICAGGPAAAGVSLPACAAPDAAQLSNCPPLATKYASNFPFVQAHTKTETQSGGTLLPFVVAQTITGTTGSSVGACARATWGSPQGATAQTPITISECEWNQASVSGTNYAEPPKYTGAPGDIGYTGADLAAARTHEVVLVTQYSLLPSPSACEHFNGHDATGAFSYLQNTNCSLAVSPPAWVLGSPGNDPPCSTSILQANLATVVDIPVHYCIAIIGGSETAPTSPTDTSTCGDITPPGGAKWYLVKGWAKFYLSGYKVSGDARNIYGTSENCGLGGSARCIRGWFTTGVIHANAIAPPSAGGSFGSVGIVPAG